MRAKLSTEEKTVLICALLVLLAGLFAAGCEDKVLNASDVPVAVTPLPVTAAAQCQPFDVKWLIDVDASGPSFTAITSHQRNRVRVEEHSGDPWQFHAEWTYDPFVVDAYFGMRYRIAARDGDCWSNWHEFRVGPANPNASGELTAPARTPIEWTQCREHYIVAETFQPPVTGPYRLSVTTKDGNHRPGYQVGQVETLMVQTDGWVGFTDDIPDAVKEITSGPWEGLSGPIHLTRAQGSVLGVCVTVWQ